MTLGNFYSGKENTGWQVNFYLIYLFKKKKKSLAVKGEGNLYAVIPRCVVLNFNLRTNKYHSPICQFSTTGLYPLLFVLLLLLNCINLFNCEHEHTQV